MDDFYAESAKQSLLGRIGTTEDIANLCSFIASDDGKNITGSIFVSDSGALIAPPALGSMYKKVDEK